MAYLENSIGEYKFIQIQGEFNRAQQQVSVDSRPGVEGMEFTLEALKGQPFSVLTFVDCESLFDADEWAHDYKQRIGFGPQEIHKNGIYVGKYQILNVNTVDIRRIQSATGNKISTNARVLLVCQWDLVAVP